MSCVLSRLNSKLTRSVGPSWFCLRRAIGTSLKRPHLGGQPRLLQRCATKTITIARPQTSARDNGGQLQRIFGKIVGGKISPLLANVYLHYVFDLWAARWRRREATGDMIIVRYADDIVVGFEHEADARRFWDAMRKRLEEFALSLHPDKTRLIAFGRLAATRRAQRGLGKPETFTFLGFTFICGTARRGGFQIQRKTRRDRMRARLRAIKEELRRRMHQPIPEQGRWLRQGVTGYFAYHGVPTNSRALAAFRYHVLDLWRRVLRRRSQKGALTWERMTKLADAWLPQPRILHPWPQQRFAVKHPRWEPYAGMPHVRFCAGGVQ